MSNLQLTTANTSSDFTDIFGDEHTFNLAIRAAEFISKASIIPPHFRNKPSDCILAIITAKSLKLPVLQVMQATYVVNGKLGMEAKFITALINNSRIFKDRLQYKLEGAGVDRQCTVWAVDHKEQRYEALYQYRTALAEGLVDKDNSKWKTMPDTMLQYRAATLFSRLHCPEITFGMNAVDDDGRIIDVEIIQEQDVQEQAVAVDQASPETVIPPTTEHFVVPTIEEMRAVAKNWSADKKAAYDRKFSELVDANIDRNQAVRQAYEHTDKYFQ